jgi:hypothetical protein
LIDNVPDANTIAGSLPCSQVSGVTCNPATGLAYVGPVDPAVQAVLNLYANSPVNDGDLGNGTGYFRTVATGAGA